jgi:hypothetical protein
LATPTATECATYREQYAEASAALHALRMGAKAIRVSFNGKEVEYTPANRTELTRYVGELANLVRQCNGQARNPRAMIGVIPEDE